MQPNEGIVVSLASPSTTHFSRVLSALVESGTTVLEMPGDKESPTAVPAISESTLLIYSPAGGRGVHETVCRLSGALRRYRCVIVVVDHLDLGDYYDLMREGITGYFEMSEGPRRIAAGVQTLAHRFAS